MTMGKRLRCMLSLLLLFLMTFTLITPFFAYQFSSEVPISYENSKISPKLLTILEESSNVEKKIQVIVLFKDYTYLNKRQEYLSDVNVKRLEEIDTFNIVPAALYSVPIREVRKLASFQIIESIFLNEKFQAIPDIETHFNLAKNYDLPNETVPKFINAEKLWSNFNGSGIKIAILDTGVSEKHPDLKGKVLWKKSFVLEKYGFDFDENSTDLNGHGTHVAGIAAGTGAASNGMYIGVAPGAEIVNVKCLNMFGQGTTAAILKAIEWAVAMDVDIISMSLGTSLGDPNDIISMAVEKAVKEGIVVVAAAGNGGPYYSSISSPGAAYSVITVGACDWKGEVASFSSRGPTLAWSPDPDVLAPGVDVAAPLAPNSYMERVGKKLGTIIGDAYISLSGTSMSTPAVAGAVALLLQAFPALRKNNPYAIRLALMETARSLGLNENIQGAGIIDVFEAYNFLEQNLKNSFLPVVKVLPSNIPTPPQIIRFPGDDLITTAIVISGTECDIDIEISGNITNLNINIDKTVFTDIFGVSTLEIKLKIPLVVIPGKYVGQINFINHSNVDSKILASIELEVKVDAPKAKALFDWYHNFDFTDSPWHNYYLFTKYLDDMLIDLDIYEGILTVEKLEGYDILILPDTELMFTPDEKYAIWEFVKNGGSLLVLGSFYQAFAVEPLNGILSPYGILFTNKTIAEQTDLVILNFLKEILNITRDNLVEHPITSNVENISWVTGVALKTEEKSGVTDIAYLENNVVIAVADEDVTGGGRIVVFGSERMFYDDLLQENPSHIRLEENVFNWLLEKKRDIILLLDDYVYNTNSKLNLALYVLNTSILEKENVTVQITTPSGNISNVALNNVSKTVFEASFILKEEGIYTINVFVSSKNVKKYFVRVASSFPTVTRVLNTVVIKHPSDIEYPSWVKYIAGIDMICRLDDYIKITAYIPSSDSDLDVKVYISPYLQFSSMSRLPLTFKSISMTKSGNVWVATFKPSLDTFSDLYVYYVVVKDSQNNTILDMTNATGIFFVVDIEPEVSMDSIVEGQTLEEINETVKALTVSPGDTLSYKIYGSDLEDLNQELEAFALLVDYDIYVISGLPLLGFKGNLTEDGWQGVVKIPENATVKTPLGYVPLSGVLVLFLILRDKDGQIGYQYTLLYVSTGILIIPILPIFILTSTLLIVVFVVAYLVYRRKKRKKISLLPEYYPTYPIIINYCPYCGVRLPPGARYCPMCGAQIIKTEES